MVCVSGQLCPHKMNWEMWLTPSKSVQRTPPDIKFSAQRRFINLKGQAGGAASGLGKGRQQAAGVSGGVGFLRGKGTTVLGQGCKF